MSQADTTSTPTVNPDVLELAELLRPAWPAIDARLHASGVPLCEGDAGDAGDGDGGDGGGDGGDGGDGGGEPKTYDEAYVRKLRREAAQHRTEANTAKQKLQEIEDADKSETQREREAREAAEKRATEAEAKVLRADVAADKGVPAKLAKFLTGSTKEELEASADELLAELGDNRRTRLDGGVRDGDDKPSDMDAAIRAAAGRGR